MRKFLTLLLLFVASLCQAQTKDRVQDLAKAIAKAEGFGRKGTLPSRLHNPGDLLSRSFHAYPGQIGLYHHYVVFRNDTAGWAALRHQIEKVISGESKYYTVNLTFKQFSKKYATSPVWVKNVTKILSISINTPLWEFLDVAPVVTTKTTLPNLWEETQWKL